MKVSTLLLSFSLAGNAALGTAVLFWPASPAVTPLPSSTAHVAENPASPSKLNASSALSSSVPSGTWDQLRDPDLATVAARLRAAGFPPSMMRAVIGPLLGERFSARRGALEATAEKPFWKNRSEAVDPKIQAELNALLREQRELYQKLIGGDFARNDDDSRLAMRQQFGRELSPDKTDRVDAARHAYSEKINELQSKTGPGANLPEDQEKMMQLQRGFHDDLAKILSADELLEYDIRTSSSAAQLRYTLASLHPTEAEFRALFPLQQALDQQYPFKPGANTPEDMAPRQAATGQMDEQIKALLGPERFAEYQLSRNYDYQQTAKVIDRLNLPSQTTSQVYAVQQDIQRRVSAIRAATPEDRAAQNATLASEATQKISALIGPTGLEAYQQYGGQWLQRLQAPAARPRANPNKP